jgi:predicted ArsR family transcriptional regulator
VGGPLAGALVDYLAAHGPAAASDARLLSRIGASRQRASQLMHQLQSVGLLETLDQHEPGRRGRPARRFALRSPT